MTATATKTLDGLTFEVADLEIVLLRILNLVQPSGRSAFDVERSQHITFSDGKDTVEVVRVFLAEDDFNVDQAWKDLEGLVELDALDPRSVPVSMLTDEGARGVRIQDEYGDPAPKYTRYAMLPWSFEPHRPYDGPVIYFLVTNGGRVARDMVEAISQSDVDPVELFGV